MVKCMKSIKSLHLVMEIVNKGSITAISNQKGLSVAALSKQLTALEEQLGIILFKRNRNGMELTDAGKLFLPYIETIFASQHKAMQFLNAYKLKPQGKLRILAGQFFAEKFLLPYLPEFLTLYPDITIELETAEYVKNLDAMQIDLAFGGLPIHNEAWLAKPFLRTHYVLCASPQYLNQTGYPQKIEDLKSHRYITHRDRKPDKTLNIGSHTIELVPNLYVNNIHTLLIAGLSGLGLINIHEYIAKDYIARGELMPLFTDISYGHKQIYLFYSAEAMLDPKIQSFVAFIEAKKAS